MRAIYSHISMFIIFIRLIHCTSSIGAWFFYFSTSFSSSSSFDVAISFVCWWIRISISIIILSLKMCFDYTQCTNTTSTSLFYANLIIIIVLVVGPLLKIYFVYFVWPFVLIVLHLSVYFFVPCMCRHIQYV